MGLLFLPHYPEGGMFWWGKARRSLVCFIAKLLGSGSLLRECLGQSPADARHYGDNNE